MILRTNRGVKSVVITIVMLMILALSGAPNVSASSNVVVDVSAISQLHDSAIDLDLITVTDGQIDVETLIENKGLLRANEQLFQNYVKSIQSANSLATVGYIHFNENYEPELESEERVKELSRNETTTARVGILADFLDLTTLVEDNREELEDFYWDAYWAYVLTPNPATNALIASALWFKGKVEPGGPWDYKAQPGWEDMIIYGLPKLIPEQDLLLLSTSEIIIMDTQVNF